MKRFILTVGPALLNEVPLTEVHDERNIYRINGAHGSIEEVEKNILKIREQIPDADILMDLPGNKVRTKDLPDGGCILRHPTADFAEQNGRNAKLIGHRPLPL